MWRDKAELAHGGALVRDHEILAGENRRVAEENIENRRQIADLLQRNGDVEAQLNSVLADRSMSRSGAGEVRRYDVAGGRDAAYSPLRPAHLASATTGQHVQIGSPPHQDGVNNSSFLGASHASGSYDVGVAAEVGRGV